MIYSDEINKVCGLCRYGEAREDGFYCARRKKAVAETEAACRKFEYDILKRSAKRKRRKLKTYPPSDFELE